MAPKVSLQQRLDQNTVKDRKPDACWLWTGYRNSAGYGVFALNGVKRRAHRAAWEASNGPIPTGKSILHSCDNPRCVNPLHLSVGDAIDNTRDMESKGRALYFGRVHHARHLLREQDAADLREYASAIDDHDLRSLGAV